MHVSTQYSPANPPSSLAAPSRVGSRVASTLRMLQRSGAARTGGCGWSTRAHHSGCR
jgi:hypothetical protein